MSTILVGTSYRVGINLAILVEIRLPYVRQYNQRFYFIFTLFFNAVYIVE